MSYRRFALLLALLALPACGKSHPNRLSSNGHEIGALAFIEGFEAGWAEVKKQSKPALVFFTKHG